LNVYVCLLPMLPIHICAGFHYWGGDGKSPRWWNW
jgi:hypothetical protein